MAGRGQVGGQAVQARLHSRGHRPAPHGRPADRRAHREGGRRGGGGAARIRRVPLHPAPAARGIGDHADRRAGGRARRCGVVGGGGGRRRRGGAAASGPAPLDGRTCTTVGHLAERYRRRLGRDGARAGVRCVDPPGCRAAERCHRRPGRCLGTQCVLACAAPGSFTSPFSISSSHSRCTSFSAAVGKNPLGAKMREGSSGDSVVSAVPARQAR